MHATLAPWFMRMVPVILALTWRLSFPAIGEQATVDTSFARHYARETRTHQHGLYSRLLILLRNPYLPALWNIPYTPVAVDITGFIRSTNDWDNICLTIPSTRLADAKSRFCRVHAHQAVEFKASDSHLSLFKSRNDSLHRSCNNDEFTAEWIHRTRNGTCSDSRVYIDLSVVLHRLLRSLHRSSTAILPPGMSSWITTSCARSPTSACPGSPTRTARW